MSGNLPTDATEQPHALEGRLDATIAASDRLDAQVHALFNRKRSNGGGVDIDDTLHAAITAQGAARADQQRVASALLEDADELPAELVRKAERALARERRECDEPEPEEAAPDRDKCLRRARRKLHLPDLTGVLKRGQSNASYDLRLRDGTTVIPLGTSADLMNPRRVEAAIADVTGAAIPYFGPKQFRRVAEDLLSIAEAAPGGATEREETLEWLISLDRAEGHVPVDMHDRESLRAVLGFDERGNYYHAESCFRGSDNRLYVRLNDLVKHVTGAHGARTTAKDLGARLGRLGFTNEQPAVRDGERVMKTRYRVSPPDFDPRDG